MADRKSIKTRIPEIVAYWSGHVDESDLSVDIKEAHERCWRCGCKRRLQRCHIVPDSLGGQDEPSNFVLLCARCHLENPNVADPDIMWDWLKAYKTICYDTFWINHGMQEYEKIYGCSFKEEIKKRNITDFSVINQIISGKISRASYHFGDPHFNVATIAGILRMSLKEYDQIQDPLLNRED